MRKLFDFLSFEENFCGALVLLVLAFGLAAHWVNLSSGWAQVGLAIFAVGLALRWRHQFVDKKKIDVAADSLVSSLALLDALLIISSIAEPPPEEPFVPLQLSSPPESANEPLSEDLEEWLREENERWERKLREQHKKDQEPHRLRVQFRRGWIQISDVLRNFEAAKTLAAIYLPSHASEVMWQVSELISKVKRGQIEYAMYLEYQHSEHRDIASNFEDGFDWAYGYGGTKLQDRVEELRGQVRNAFRPLVLARH